LKKPDHLWCVPPSQASTPSDTFAGQSIGDRLRYLLEVKSVSQVSLAKHVGVTQAAISNIVTNASRKPNAHTLLKLCDTLHCDPRWLMTGAGTPAVRLSTGGPSEFQLLQLFRTMSETARTATLAVARVLGEERTN